MSEQSPARLQWGAIYNDSSKTVWRWDKRDFTETKHSLKV